VFEVQSSLSLVLSIVLFLVKLGALVDCVARDDSKFAQVGTMPRRNWLIILGLTVAVHAVDWNPLGILNLLGTVAALVYLALLRGSD
jgi:uncharacterized protein DUF2516